LKVADDPDSGAPMAIESAHPGKVLLADSSVVALQSVLRLSSWIRRRSAAEA